MWKRPKSCVSGFVLLLLLITFPCVFTYRAARQQHLDHILIAAVGRNDPEAVRAALHDGADPNCRVYSHAPTPIWRAWLNRFRGMPDTIGSNPVLMVALSLHEQYEDYQPPLIVAYRDNRVIKILVEAGADANSVSKDGSSALVQAVEWTGVETVQLLLDHRANVNSRDRDGANALLVAVGKPDTAVARLLVTRGAEIDSRDNGGMTPLMHAAEAGTPEMLRFLLQQQADNEARDNNGKTAIQYARGSYNFTAVRLLETARASH